MTRDGMVIGTFDGRLEWPGTFPAQESGGQLAPKAARTWAGTVCRDGGQPTAADPGPAATPHAPPETWA